MEENAIEGVEVCVAGRGIGRGGVGNRLAVLKKND
jgi:hypothetical protein